MKQLRTIINADDLGQSEHVNDAIFQLMRMGRVTSATVLANGPRVEDAAKRLQELPHCSFGAHLNLSGFQPITRHPGLRPILDDDGSFAGNALREARFTASLREGIFLELCEQIEKLRRLGISISHLDSHHHVHTVPSVFTVLKALQRRFGIRKVRLTLNIYPPRHPLPWHRLVFKSLWNMALRHWYRTVATDGFTSFKTFAEMGSRLSRRYQSVELMVHPGLSGYEDETQLLYGDWWKGLPFEVKPISYLEL